MNIWVVDDDPAIVSLLSIAVARVGAQYQGFSSVEEALRTLQEERAHPDVCLADWSLKDGPILRIRPLMPKTRFVVMSGNPAVEDSLPAGIEWLPKPFRLAELNRLLTPREH
ncbi:MAG: DNA-binding response regulator [Firmicutes bacterium]|nr:DNA-binding response regulator [Bacillota bacterium]